MEIYKDKNYSASERAKNLLSLMTLDEKIDQLHVVNPEEHMQALKEGKCEHEFGIMFPMRSQFETFTHKLQSHATEETRLRIPVLFCVEGLHGFSYFGSTIFPQNVGLGCSFNEKLSEEVGKETARAAASRGIRCVFAPVVDVARDPRWGRTQESYGEDPYLIGKCASSYVRGLQSQGVAATLKHYIAYSIPENGLNMSAAHVGEREIREMFLPPYEECIKAGAKCIMPAYNEIDGVPAHASKKWLKDVLRGELGFEGVLISDWGGIIFLNNFHHIADCDWKAGKMAMEASVDVEAPDYFGYNDNFKEKVRSGEISEALVDECVLRVLKLKFELGLFDGRDSWKKQPIHTKKSAAIARKAAEQSIVLLKNDGILPLDIRKKQKIALIGPNAKRVQMGDYCFSAGHPYGISLYKALSEKLGEDNLLYAMGSNIVKRYEDELENAVETAKNADVVILALGDNSIAEGGGGVAGVDGTRNLKEPITDGEGFDVSSLELPNSQKELFERIAAIGKPIITVMFTGRARVIVNEYNRSAAFVQAWYPGEQGGYALADILFGDVNPSAKLSVSFPRSEGHLPCNYNHRVSSRGKMYRKPGTPENPGYDYVFSSPTAFLPFGFGLSYTKYEYSNLKVRVIGDAQAEVSVKVSNVGERDGEEPVLVFLKRLFSESVPYEKELKAFRRVKLKAGESKNVCFTLDRSAFIVIDEQYRKKVEHGKHFVLVGDQKAEFTV